MGVASRAAQGLIAVALAGLLGVTAWHWRLAWEDSGRFAFVLFGVPLACGVLALLAETVGRTAVASGVVGALAVMSLAWSLVTGLGIGLAFLLPSLLLLGAAAASWGDRRRHASSGQQRLTGSRRP
ncbi:hypothetical protein [Blastococcus sp. PRF04-17]|uniref:hypothetical protein n=1 Tax=Blastococcus sp. PRF04-17 TaxID=2933797 RepID=UPI001FF37480|nr:hypothetical protein [Blastococcus sp. PRF04-17]UOY00863.1 hypothetical protein MVA48_18060 [Blastococcus sp. PRF04-17]